MVERPPNRTRQEPTFLSQRGQPLDSKNDPSHVPTWLEYTKEKTPALRRNRIEDRSTEQNRAPEPPTRRARLWEVGQWPTPTGKMPGGRLADPPGQGTLCRVPGTPRSATYLTFRPV